MNTNKHIAARGFTIIEVVLVLAIAGLIFLIVFLAVPALNRSQRDTQRRNDFSRFMTQIQQYQTNNSGRVPAEADVEDFVDSYLKVGGDDWADPLTDSYSNVAKSVAKGDLNTGEYQYAVGQKCDGEDFIGSGARSAAVRVKLEGAGVYCADNS